MAQQRKFIVSWFSNPYTALERLGDFPAWIEAELFQKQHQDPWNHSESLYTIELGDLPQEGGRLCEVVAPEHPLLGHYGIIWLYQRPETEMPEPGKDAGFNAALAQSVTVNFPQCFGHFELNLVRLCPEDTPLLRKAIQFAYDAHDQQVDKAGQDYILHPLRVMTAMETEMEKVVGVLHDAVEDSDLTLSELEQAGFPSEALAAIAAITKQEGEDYETYLERVINNPIALKVKIADMTHNMDLSRITQPTERDFQRWEKYRTILPRLQAALG